MKNILMILMMAILLPLSAFAAHKKKQQADSTPEQQDGTDWLNAPTPDGSPTLKETSDWLATTFADYGGENSSDGMGMVYGVHIDNDCSFHYTWKETRSQKKNDFFTTEVAIPLGVVTRVAPSIDDERQRIDGVTFDTGQVEAIRLVGHGRGNEFVKYNNSDAFSVLLMPQPRPGGEVPQRPDQMVPRMVSALQHAVSLCQSTYKAPAATKQPF